MFRVGRLRRTIPWGRPRCAPEWLRNTEGSAILEFSITIPLLVVFVVGIYDFSGAFNQKQKIEQAAQEGAIVAGAQPMTDIAPESSSGGTNPDSLQPVVTAVFNSMANSGVLPNAGGNCTPHAPPWPTSGQSALTWIYQISGCGNSGDLLQITINRGWTQVVPNTTPPTTAVGTIITVTYPYHWRFNSVIQLLIPGAAYQAITSLTESASVHNQM